MSDENTAPELSEDMEVIGPGQMLAEARIQMGLSQEQVAEKLNFRPALVRDIEAEIFDKSLPTTFNRGYLRNYAKLVNISVEQVLASYEMLGVAEAQGAELQSFSKITKKQAETNLVLWISYLVVALLIASTVMWWLQDVKEDDTSLALPQKTPMQTQTQAQAPATGEAAVNTLKQESAGESVAAESAPASSKAEETTLADNADAEPVQAGTESAAEQQDALAATEQQVPEQQASEQQATGQTDTADSREVSEQADETQQLTAQQQEANPLSTAVFTFSGDCYVNIFDATGERIAYGLKKSGYVMTITGVAPLNITIGRPDLVAINFDGQEVDMSNYPGSNIAKFNLPMNPPGP